MQDKLPDVENTPTVTERRACPRFRVSSLMYIDIGSVNGGIVTSLSKKGLALTAADALVNAELGDGPLRMRIQFPGTSETIEASGEIVWTSPSGKEARVRFVEIGDAARGQIYGWVSDQARSNGLRPQQSKLPNMKLPNSRRTKPRASKFSFADVASSRLDGEGETGVDDFPEIAGEPGKLPPLQGGGVGFRDGAEVVASAFESAALGENRTGGLSSLANGQATHAAFDREFQQQPSPSIPERRQLPRKQILLFTYAVLGEDNGGLVFNLGEGGLALTAAAALLEQHFAKMRVRFPDSSDWFETSGRLVWKSDSGKEAGVEFLSLPEDARARIREWLLQGEQAGDLPAKEGGAQTSQNSVQELPSFVEPEESSSEPFEIPASFEEQPFENQGFEEHRFENEARTPAASSTALFETGIKGILERASLRRRVAKIKPPQIPGHSPRPQTHVARKALSIAAGVALAVGGWMFFQRTPSNEASGIVAENLPTAQPSQEAAQKPNVQKTEPDLTVPATDPAVQPSSTQPSAVQQSEDLATHTDTGKPSIQQVDTGSPPTNTPPTATTSASANPDRGPKEKPRSERAVTDPPPKNLSRKSYQSQAVFPARREQEAKAPQLIASVPPLTSDNKLAENKPAETKSPEAKPAESKPVQIAQVLPTVNSNKESSATPPALNSNPPQPAAPPLVDPAKEKPSVAPKQPDPVLARTPLVTVNFDPFPSIRMPKKEKSKKSQQGKSLQMGRLVMRVDPVYPEEARQQGIEGTVRLHAIFNRDGAVQSVISVSGPPLLVPTALNAVRQWRYSQTILGGQAMETEEDVNVQFRLTNSATKN